MPFVTEYLQAAWVEGVDVTCERGLKAVLQRAGCPADLAPVAEPEWRNEVEQNLATMQEHDLWGVPSSGSQEEGSHLSLVGDKIESGA